MRHLSLFKFAFALNRRLGAPNRTGDWLRQRGAFILPLALAGLLGTSAIAVPLLSRSLIGVDAAKNNSSIQTVDTEAAAWYAMWRLEHDPTIHTEFTGVPPTTTFQFRGADITLVGIEPLDNSGIIMSMSASPNLALPNTPTVVTYTLVVKNDDDEAHDILRVEVDPAGSFGPTYVPNSTTGMTTVEPSTQANRFTWSPVTPITIDPFGAELTMSWQMTVDEGEGNYWMDGEVRIDGVGDIEGLTEANVLVTPPNDIVVTVDVTPQQVNAGDIETHSFTIDIENTSLSDYQLTDVKFWTTKQLDVDFGTSSGVSGNDPQRNSDTKSNQRWEWTWGGMDIDLDSGQSLSQTFQTTGGLPPGTWFSEAAIKTEESTANGQEVAATSSATAPIKAVRVYDIHVDFLGTLLDIEARLDTTGVEALTWVESR